jgi:hypothetical protein
MAVLAHENQLVWRGRRDNRQGCGVFDHVDSVFRSVAVTHRIDANVEDAAFEATLGGENSRCFFHRAAFWRNAHTTPRKLPTMPQPPSSISAEIGWLAFFLAIFVGTVYLAVRLLVPHHFNDKVAIMLAAIFAGLILIAARAWFTRRLRAR